MSRLHNAHMWERAGIARRNVKGLNRYGQVKRVGVKRWTMAREPSSGLLVKVADVRKLQELAARHVQPRCYVRADAPVPHILLTWQDGLSRRCVVQLWETLGGVE